MEVRELKEDMDRRFEAVDQRFEALIELILAEGGRTRRHFEVFAEQLFSERNLAIDRATAVDQRVGRLTASNAADHVDFRARLADHERRLTDLEQEE